MKNRIEVAQIKVVPEKGDVERNFGRLMSLLGRIAVEKPDVVVTPECFLDGYMATVKGVNRDNMSNYAVDPRNSPYVKTLSEWAAAHSAWIVLGCSRLSPEGVYNSALVFDRRGRLAGWYDKTHLQAHDKKYVQGDSIHAFRSDFGVFGVMICADRRWPEVTRSLALQGAQVIFNPTYGMHDERNLHMMQTRSYESECYIAFTHPLQSLLTGPEGRVITNEKRKTVDFAITRIDLSLANRVRKGAFSHLKDRRPEIYTQS